ncbi:MAG: hypothetical protein H7247_00025, partial [Polaromonas sp.]|nr:hypothetical protein [Gemmatimonadaceae bacterium]
ATQALALGLVFTSAALSGAQGTLRSGGGYAIGTPVGALSLHAGYAHANANSDLFSEYTNILTLSKGDFSGPMVGAELAIRLGRRFDVTFDADYIHARASSEFRRFVDTKNRPIEQTTTFQRVPLTVNLKAYLGERGRSIGKLAWIPNKVVPWVGAGGGALWSRFRIEGDFVNFTNNNVFSSRLTTDGWTPVGQAMAGVDVTVSPRVALGLDVRSLWGSGDVGGNFSGFDKIDVSGVSALIGITFRL